MRGEDAYELLAYITHEGVMYRLHTDPLRPLIEQMRRRTDERRWNVENWGGYQTRWETEDDYLFLTEVFGFDLNTGRQLSMAKLFSDVHAGAPRADWFTGRLHCPHGRVLAAAGRPGRFSEFLLILDVQNGRLMEKIRVRSPLFSQSQSDLL